MGSPPSLKRGDVVLIRYPFTDLTSSKVRPAILLSVPMTGTDRHFVFIGSSPAPLAITTIQIPSGNGGIRPMGLKADPSYVYPHKIATLDLALVSRKLGSTPTLLLDQVSLEVARVLGV